MGLQDLERILGSFWEGIFARSSRQIQPVEIARALIQEMARQRRVSVSRIYAPNVFTVSLGKADFEKTTPLQAALCRELEEYLLKKAGERGFTLIGRPEVSFLEDEALGIGDIRVTSGFAPAEIEIEMPKKVGSGPVEPVIEDLPQFDRTMVFQKEEKEQPPQEGLFLTVVQGPDQGLNIPLQGTGPFMIGRKSTNNMALSDVNASREHAMLEWRNGVLYLVDLNSRNGTFVNGTGIEQHRLEAGDQILIGENLLQIKGG